MHLDHNRFFILSGILSFSFFLVILAIIGWQFLVAEKPLSFAMAKSDVVSISLVPSLSKPQESIIEPQEPVSEPLVSHLDSKSAVEKMPQKTEPKVEEVEISDLFSTVKANNPPQKMKEDRKQLSELNVLEEKIATSKRDSQLFEKAKTLDLAKVGKKAVAAAGSTGPLVDEYKAKVQGIIYAHFHPGSGTEGFSARVRIVLTSNGKLTSFRVISYSRSSVFNAEVDWLKERLNQVSFPKYPNGDEAIFEIILTAKE